MSVKINKNGKEYPVGVIPKNYPASNISYNNSQSGLSADNVQGAIDEVADLKDSLKYVNNPTTLYTHQSSDEVISKNFTMTSSGYVQIAARTSSSDIYAGFALLINGVKVFAIEMDNNAPSTESQKRQYVSSHHVSKGDIVTLVTNHARADLTVYYN